MNFEQSYIKHPALLLTVLIIVAAVIMRSNSLINHDTSWLLYLSSQYLDGAKLYIDVVETNPPFIIWIKIPTVWLANLTGLSLAVTFKAFIFVLAIISIGLSAALMRAIKLENWLNLIPVLAFVLMLLPGQDFGQREHLLVLLTVPYLLVISARANEMPVSRVLIVSATIMGLCGFLIKPHFVPIPLALELYLLWKIGLRKTFFRPEPYLLGCGAIIYLAVVWFYTPAYFSRVVRYGAEVYGAGFKAPFFYTSIQLLIPMGLLLLARKWVAARGREHVTSFFAVFLIAALVMYAIYAVQSKGWTYHIYPGLAYLTLALASLLISSWDKAFGQNNKSVTTIGLGAALVAVSMQPTLSYKYQPDAVLQWNEVIDTYPETDSLFIMSANVYHGFPLVTERNMTWASRFACLWTLPGLQIKRQQLGHSTPKLDEIEHYTRQAVAEDIARFQPDLVFVDIQDNKHHFKEVSFNYIENFSQNELFLKQWKFYKKVDVKNGFEIFQRNENYSEVVSLPKVSNR